MTRWNRSRGPIPAALFALAALFTLAGCGASDEAPQQGDNPAAANARSSAAMGERASARAQSAPQRSGTKLKAAGESARP